MRSLLISVIIFILSVGSISWATAPCSKEEFDKMEPAFITNCCLLFKRDNKYVYTFASFDETSGLSDRTSSQKDVSSR